MPDQEHLDHIFAQSRRAAWQDTKDNVGVFKANHHAEAAGYTWPTADHGLFCDSYYGWVHLFKIAQSHGIAIK